MDSGPCINQFFNIYIYIYIVDFSLSFWFGHVQYTNSWLYSLFFLRVRCCHISGSSSRPSSRSSSSRVLCFSVYAYGEYVTCAVQIIENGLMSTTDQLVQLKSSVQALTCTVQSLEVCTRSRRLCTSAYHGLVVRPINFRDYSNIVVIIVL